MFNDLMIAGGGIGGAPSIDLTENLIAHYLLNNNADDSVGTYDGTPSGGVDFQGDMAKFDGVDDYILNPLDTNGTKTISFWFDFGGTVVNDSMYSTLNTVDIGFTIFAHPTEIIYFQNRDSAVVHTIVSGSVNIPIVFNTKHNLVIEYNDTELKMYLDDVLKYHATLSTPYTSMTSITLGRETSTYYYRSNLSNLRIYSDNKDQSFITALHEEGYYPKPLPLPTTDGLIAHYPLTGTAEDTTGNYDGVEVGGLTYIDDTEFGSVANFDGVDDAIDTGSCLTNITTALTITGWFNIDGLVSTKLLSADATNTNLNNIGFSPYHANGNYYLDFGEIEVGDTGRLSGIANTSWLNRWTFGTMVADGSFLGFYIDGVLVASRNDNNTTVSGHTIGKIGSYGTNFPIGNFKDVRVYNRGLQVQEITDIYNYEKNFRPIDIDDGLVAFYPLANNSLDNYRNQRDGVDTAMTYNGLSGVFNGVNSHILDDIAILTNPLTTITCWAKFNNLTATQTLHSFMSATTGSVSGLFVLYEDAGTAYLKWQYTSSIGWEIFETNVSDLGAGYNHLSVIITATKIIFLVNGVVRDTFSIVNSVLIASYKQVIGAYMSNYSPVGVTDGNISKVRVYNKAITAEQVEVIYNTEKGDFI